MMRGFRAVTAGLPLKPDVVLFGEYLPVAASTVAGGEIVIISGGATPYDARAAARCGGDVEVELAAIAEALGLAG
jgi:hypothetical protein